MDKEELVSLMGQIRARLEQAECMLDEINEEDVPIDWRGEFRTVRDLTSEASYEAYCLEGAIEDEEEEEEDEQAA